jgi:hypothetical protein
MEIPQIRPGRVNQADPPLQIVAFFYNSAQGNLAIQLLTAVGIPNDQIGVTPPERIETDQGMVLSIGCADEKVAGRVESICRQQGAKIHRQRRA